MTTEQKEAKDLVKDFTKIDFNNPMGWTGYYDTELKELQQAIEIVLNLIQEQQIELEKNRLIKQRDIDNQMQKLFQQSVKIIEQDNQIKKQRKLINYILREQIACGFLVNFNTLNEAKKYYERKMENDNS